MFLAFLISLSFLPLLTKAQSTIEKTNKRTYFIRKDNLRLVGNYIYNSSQSSFAIDSEFSGIRPLTFESYFNKKGKEKRKLWLNTFGFSFFQLGYEYNFHSKVNSLRLGVFQFISPFSINPIQFIHQGGSESTKGWIYRPEAGFGYWIFQINYGYNFYLKEELRIQPKHNFIIKIHLPF